MTFLRIFLITIGVACLDRGGAKAQTPGYLGMRMAVTANLSGFPSLSDSNSTINGVLSGGISYVWTRNMSSVLYVQNCATQLGYISEETQRYGRVKIQGWGIGASHRWYFYRQQGVSAPLGLFQEVRLTYLNYKMYDRYGNFYDNNPPQLNQYLGKGQGLVVQTGICSQRIVYQYILFQYGVRFGYLLPNLFKKHPNAQLERLSLQRLRRFNSFELSGGVGLLIL